MILHSAGPVKSHERLVHDYKQGDRTTMNAGFITIDEGLESLFGKEVFWEALNNKDVPFLPPEVFIPWKELQKGGQPFVFTMILTAPDGLETHVQFYPYVSEDHEYGFHFTLVRRETVLPDGNHRYRRK